MKNYLYRHRYLAALSILNFLLVFVSSFNTLYGFFIDEFYYLACANHPALGYVDHPPLAPLLLTVFTSIFGKSIYAVRFLPALASSVSVFLTGKLTEQIGGKRQAQILAALALVCTPVALAFAGFYSMNVFEPLLTIIMVMISVDMIKKNDSHKWLAMGLVMGIGIMNKHTFVIAIIMFMAAMFIGGHWRLFFNRWFLLGGVIAVLIVLPNILWQAANGFPSAEFYHNITNGKNIDTPPLQFIIGQIITMSPSNVIIWLAGTIFLLINKEMRTYRYFALFFVFIFVFMMLSGTSRSDRALFAYPIIFAGGALFFEQFLSRFNRRWVYAILPVSLIIGLLISLPLILPYFTYEQVASYVKTTGINTEIEKGKKPPLPQLLADRIGWEEKSDMLFKAYNSLSEAEKKVTVISADNYGKAGALELYGKKYGINDVFCGHNTYYLWGKERLRKSKDGLHGATVLILDNEEDLRGYKRSFDSVVVSSSTFNDPFVSSHENGLKVFLCRNAKYSLAALFEQGRCYR